MCILGVNIKNSDTFISLVSEKVKEVEDGTIGLTNVDSIHIPYGDEGDSIDDAISSIGRNILQQLVVIKETGSSMGEQIMKSAAIRVVITSIAFQRNELNRIKQETPKLFQERTYDVSLETLNLLEEKLSSFIA